MAALRARRVRQVPRLTAVAKKKKANASKSSREQHEQLEEIRRLLDDVLVAQHRTNQLLELALRAGFDDAEHARTDSRQLPEPRTTQEDSP